MRKLIVKENMRLQYFKHAPLFNPTHEEQFSRVHTPRVQGCHHALI